MDVKGQVSVEYLLVILVIIIILGSVSIPLIKTSINSSMDISKTSDVSVAVHSIANAADVVYANGPGALRTISIYIPVDSNLVFDGNTLEMDVTNVLAGGTTKKESASVAFNTVKLMNSTNSNTNTIGVKKGWYNNVTVYWPPSDDGTLKSIQITIR